MPAVPRWYWCTISSQSAPAWRPPPEGTCRPFALTVTKKQRSPYRSEKMSVPSAAEEEAAAEVAAAMQPGRCPRTESANPGAPSQQSEWRPTLRLSQRCPCRRSAARAAKEMPAVVVPPATQLGCEQPFDRLRRGAGRVFGGVVCGDVV